MNKEKETNTEQAASSAVETHCYMANLDYRNPILDKLSRLENDELEALEAVVDQLLFARKKHPEFPKDLIHQSAIVSEEAGELTQACLQERYERGSFRDCIDEAIQTGAMALRFIVQR